MVLSTLVDIVKHACLSRKGGYLHSLVLGSTQDVVVRLETEEIGLGTAIRHKSGKVVENAC
jgi:hypothetical protein